MKKTFVNLFAVIVLFSVTAFGSNVPSITIEGSKALIVDTKSWNTEVLTVKIKNDDGKMVFDEKLTMDKAKKFNFENLQDGLYTVIMADEFKTTEQNFIISDNKIELIEDLTKVYKPIITIGEDKIDLNFMSDGSKTMVSIHDTNNAVFNVKIEGETSISKRFNISDLPKGAYTFYVTTNNTSYWKKFRI